MDFVKVLELYETSVIIHTIYGGIYYSCLSDYASTPSISKCPVTHYFVYKPFMFILGCMNGCMLGIISPIIYLFCISEWLHNTIPK